MAVSNPKRDGGKKAVTATPKRKRAVKAEAGRSARSRKATGTPMSRSVAGMGLTAGALPDLSQGVIVVLSGGGVDIMNPVEVRERMDEYITRVNDDGNVKAATGGNGLTFRLLSGQKTNHLHQTRWRDICQALSLRQATPLILVGHSNGGAAAMDLARCLQSQGKTVDLLITADSVLTLDDIGEITQVPPNVKLNINSYTIPTPAWFLAPFPIGTRNRRQVDGSLEGILNVGLKYNLPGVLAHRNAFYDLAGGGKRGTGPHPYPFLLLESTLAVLFGRTNFEVIGAAIDSLQILSTKARVEIEVASTMITKTLRP